MKIGDLRRELYGLDLDLLLMLTRLSFAPILLINKFAIIKNADDGRSGIRCYFDKI